MKLISLNNDVLEFYKNQKQDEYYTKTLNSLYEFIYLNKMDWKDISENYR